MDDLLPNFRLHLAIGLVLLAGTLAVLLIPAVAPQPPPASRPCRPPPAPARARRGLRRRRALIAAADVQAAGLGRG